MVHQEFENGGIDRGVPVAMRTWAQLLGVSQSEMPIAVARVADHSDAVRTCLARPSPEPLA